MEVLTNALTLLRKFVAGLAKEVKAAEQDTIEFGRMDLLVKDIDQCHELSTSLLTAWQMQFGDELRKAIVQGNKPNHEGYTYHFRESETVADMIAIAYEFGVEARIASFAHPKSVIEEGLKYEIVDLKDTIEKLDEQQKSKDEEISRLKEEVHGVRSEKQKSIRERNRLSLALRAKEED
jgi:uncharacterized protein YlxW (UPF0749 family)